MNFEEVYFERDILVEISVIGMPVEYTSCDH